MISQFCVWQLLSPRENICILLVQAIETWFSCSCAMICIFLTFTTPFNFNRKKSWAEISLKSGSLKSLLLLCGVTCNQDCQDVFTHERKQTIKWLFNILRVGHQLKPKGATSRREQTVLKTNANLLWTTNCWSTGGIYCMGEAFWIFCLCFIVAQFQIDISRLRWFQGGNTDCLLGTALVALDWAVWGMDH